MILIITDKEDTSSANVIAYLIEQESVVINREHPNSLSSISFNIDIDSKTTSILLINGKINKIWLRRGSISFSLNTTSRFYPEVKIYNDFLLKQIEKLPLTLGSLYNEENHNKLMDLQLAVEFGLNIPKTFIRSCVDTDEMKGMITKSLYNPIQFEYKGELYYGGGTERIEEGHTTGDFLPSLFQEEIEKKFEIRCFYLKGKFYSMAIFSQNNPKTKLDYRDYDFENMNRMIPFNLPDDIAEKLRCLLDYKNLDCCSIDFIYSTDDQFYFLEINAVGQYGWLSDNCNYNLDKIIAEELCKN